jgi:hypothetical protein
MTMAPDEDREDRLRRLDVFVGEWRLEIPAFPLPPELAGDARTTFGWDLGGAFLLQALVGTRGGGPGRPERLDAGDGYTSSTSTPVGSRASTR